MIYFGETWKLQFLAAQAPYEVIFLEVKPIYSQNVLPENDF